jgi:hypothetical protein
MFLRVYYVLLPILLSLANPLSGAPPYPPSPVITDLEWAPKSSIQRVADGSDTFPMTWADDGSLYTAFGDGNGFEPQISDRLSLGFARIDGPATDFSAENIRSNAEQTGHGSEGKKASGMLMVDSVLYMWVRNADNNGQKCQLAWSTDHAKTWIFSDWRFDQFGYCTFINYGQNYAGARDNYVYTVTHDNPSAYEAADRFILMRVPKEQMEDKVAYEFFVRLDGSGQPQWSSAIGERGSVFNHPGLARRSGISYIAGLNRYLWWQQANYGSVDTRYEGGFGVFDAPEPWGPWTTVYHTTKWDVGPGETGSFPPKWASSDGKTLYLVFSGEDSFAVRKATLTLADDDPSDQLPTPTAPSLPTAAPTSTSLPSLDPTLIPTATPLPTSVATPAPGSTPEPTLEPTSIPTETTTPAPAAPTATPTTQNTQPTPDPSQANRTIQVRVAHSEDDAEEDAAKGEVSVRSRDLEMSENQERPQLVGVRFQGVDVPPGALVVNAYVQFHSHSTGGQSTSLQIYGEDAFQARAFSSEPKDISTRIRTESSLVWNDVPAWSAVQQAHETPNLALIVQEIIGQENWRSGNPMAFIFTGNGKRSAASYDGLPSAAPLLVIEYTLPVYVPLILK